MSWLEIVATSGLEAVATYHDSGPSVLRGIEHDGGPFGSVAAIPEVIRVAKMRVPVSDWSHGRLLGPGQAFWKA